MGEEKSDAFELIACKYVRYALERAYMVLRLATGGENQQGSVWPVGAHVPRGSRWLLMWEVSRSGTNCKGIALRSRGLVKTCTHKLH